MAQWVSIWRAAHLAGVPRSALQARVRTGEMEESDGMVSLEALRTLYPQLQTEASGLAERVTRIRDEAFGQRLRERLLPSQEVLAHRLLRQGQELADAQRHLQRYHALVVALRNRLRAGAGEDARFADLERELTAGLARVLATDPVQPHEVLDEVLKVVSAQVTLRPSGHQFHVEGRDSLLQAALRAGLSVNYGCGNGTCGMCKVRVTAGDVARCGPSDYPLSEAEKRQGYVLACAHTAASAELTLETLEAAGPADIPEQHVGATVRVLRTLATDTLLLHLQTPRSHRLRFLAGQSVTLALAGEAGAQARYPVASCPCDDRNLQFFIARDEADPLAARLFGGDVRAGDPVTVWGPYGEFTLAPGRRPLVFVACDRGFAPVKSLVEHALSLDAAPSLTLFWLATGADGHFLANQCRAWSEALEQFEYTLFNDFDPGRGAARVAAAMREDLFEVDCEFHLAGPPAFVAPVREQLLVAGVPPAQIRVELL
ncbi:MAG: 2Fe-2S iron-sulfur cluster binding domain-containing protein [Burkholderiales bacterium]|nr:2Fe-2S iron-sulfur cluster binding domain-containing protein [Burkholderiales bacterium]